MSLKKTPNLLCPISDDIIEQNKKFFLTLILSIWVVHIVQSDCSRSTESTQISPPLGTGSDRECGNKGWCRALLSCSPNTDAQCPIQQKCLRITRYMRISELICTITIKID